MQGFLDWLGGLPPVALYIALAVTAASENFFPPLPADTVVAFGSFVAARAHGSPVWAILSTWIGNVSGAMAVYLLGRRYGTERVAKLEHRLAGGKEGAGSARIQRLYARYGLVALFLSRFLPGVRALVPPFAGAARIAFVPAVVAIGSASLLWYGTIGYVAFRVGADWHAVTGTMSRYGRIAAIGAAVLALAIGAWAWMRHRRSARP